MISSYDFMVVAKKAVVEWMRSNGVLEDHNASIDWADIAVVWQCKALRNHKVVLVSPLPDNLLFEVTYNGEKNEMYFDAYEKRHNQVIQL